MGLSINRALREMALVTFFTLGLGGCAVSVPVQECTPPETLGAWGFRFYAAEGSSPMVAPPDTSLQSTGSPGVASINEGVGLDIGILEFLDFQAFTAAGTAGNSSRIGGKLQWLGQSYFKTEAGKWAASVGAHAISSNGVSFNSQGNTQTIGYFQNVTGNGYDIENSFGYRVASWFGFYLGPKFISMNVQGQYSNTSSTGPFTSSSLNFNGYGGFFGLYLSPHSQHIGFEMTVEFQEMNMPATYSSNYVWYPTLYVSMGLPFKF